MSRLESERKSRRTHKNSRDGCPNCKAKRIKCSEELPQCHNCLKKRYRCGYIDFPPEKLELLRKKNETRSKERVYDITPVLPIKLAEPDGPRSPSFVPAEYGQRAPPEQHLQPQYPLQQQQQHSSHQFQGQALTPNLLEGGQYKAYPYFIDESMQKSEYAHLIELPEMLFREKQPPGCVQYYPPQGGAYGFGEEPQAPSQTMSFHSHYLGPPQTDAQPHLFGMPPFERGTFEGEGLSASLPPSLHTNSDSSITSIAYSSSPMLTNPKPPATRGQGTTLAKPSSRLAASQMLPNGEQLPVTFVKIEKIQRLKNPFLERYLKLHTSDLRLLNNLEFRNVAPVWTQKIAENFWTTVYNQSVVLDLYYTFFMDRSLNALIHRAKSLLDDQAFLQNENVLFLPQPKPLLHKKYFFTPHDLDVLTHKSYIYYGFLIKDLRESLSLIHSEYPAKISLFAAWSTFLHSQSSVETFCLLFCGTTTLFSKVFNNATSLKSIPPTLNTGFYIFINHSNTCLVPDYDIQVMVDLHKDLIELKKFCQRVCYGWMNEVDNDKVLSKVCAARHCFDLEIFMRKLLEDYYPQIMNLNASYKRKYRPDDQTNNIYFVRVRAFYELVTHWFAIYPAEAIPVGSKYDAMIKTFYLFFNAIGKALSHVLTPIRSLILVDPNHTFCPRVDFNPQLYRLDQGIYSDEDFAVFQKVSQKLIRTTSFFNNRVLFYSYYLLTVTVLDAEYIKRVSLDAGVREGGVGGYKDVLQLIPNKLNIDEEFVHSFDRSVVIGPQNYPVMEFFRDEFNRILALEQHQRLQSKFRQRDELEAVHHQSVDEFCYRVGMFERDFKPEKWIEVIVTRQTQACEEEMTTLAQLQNRMHNFDLGRQEVNNSIK